MSIKQFLAARRLQKLVEAKRRSFEIEQYRRNRAAQIGHRQMRRATLHDEPASLTLTEA